MRFGGAQFEKVVFALLILRSGTFGNPWAIKIRPSGTAWEWAHFSMNWPLKQWLILSLQRNVGPV